MIVFLTGAGVSVPSGLPTYRGPGGLYEDGKTVDGMPIEEFLSAENRAVNPEMVASYILSMHERFKNVQPNEIHKAIGQVQAKLGSQCVVITQNVDDLHERGGATQVVHLHGTTENPVLFGMDIPIEAISVLWEIADKIDTLVIIGTTVAFDYLEGFIHEAKTWGANLILMDTDPEHRYKDYVAYFVNDSSRFVPNILGLIDDLEQPAQEC